MTKITLHEFLPGLFGHTVQSVYICSFPNERDDPNQATERHITTRVAAQVEAFASKWDKPGRGAFFCVGTVKAGTKRNKDNIVETIGLHADIDFKAVEGSNVDLAEVTKQLARLRIQPSVTLFSGGGVHAYWLFAEPLATQESTGAISNIERIEDALKLLADLVAGDPSVCEVSRVMRLPQTHNTKGGHWTEVEITSFNPDRRYELDDLEEWLSEVSPVMLRKTREVATTAGETNWFTEYAKNNKLKVPNDIEKLAASMMYMGGDENGVHASQIKISSSLLSSGVPVNEVVDYVYSTTQAAAGEYGKRWNWRREERTIRKDCNSWLKDHPEIAAKQPKTLDERLGNLRTIHSEDKQEEKAQAAGGGSAQGAQVIQMPPPKQTPKPPQKKSEQHITLGRAVLAYLADHDEQLIRTKEGTWLFSKGIWELRTDSNWINVRIEEICVGLNFRSINKLIVETRNWIERRPELWRDEEIPWDKHGKIPTRSGLIDPVTGEIEEARSDHFCTWRVECNYNPKAKCAWWEVMVTDFFGDRKLSERDALVRVIQECLGAALIDRKPRALSKALILWGIQNLGKSGILEVLAGLFGTNVIGTSLSSVETPHGLMPFTHRLPWVLHEAFNGQWHFSSVVKSIITHEPVMINVKNGPMITGVIRAPIFWATNFQPQFKEATKAIVNRMIVIECSRAFTEGELIGAAREAQRNGYSKPSDFVLATELEGLLNWAIEGLRRALKRGTIELTSGIKATSDAIHRDSNLVAGFLDDCITFDPNNRIRVSDFCLAHSSWWMELKGEDRRLPTNEAISKAMKAVGDLRIGMDSKEMRDNQNRYYCGVALTATGLHYHRVGYASRLFEGKMATATNPDGEVNSPIPISWDTKESVVEMRNRHENCHQKGPELSPKVGDASPPKIVIE